MTFTTTPNRRWLGFELSVLRRLKFASLAVPFAGQPDLEWYLKFWGKQALTNDLCQWAWWMARALVENQGERLNEEDVALVLQNAYVPQTHLHNAALSQALNDLDAVWFDNVWQNIQQLPNDAQRAMAYLHTLGVADYVFAFAGNARELRRPLSQVFLHLWRTQRKLVNNGQRNYATNQDAHAFIRNARVDLLFARFPRPQGLAGLRGTLAGWREGFVRGHDEFWDEWQAAQRGKLGDAVIAKQHYLQLVGNFLASAKHIPKWAIAHAEDGFVSVAELGEVISQYRRIEVTYNKDFSDVLGGLNAYIIVA
jgi:hypothetical protein